MGSAEKVTDRVGCQDQYRGPTEKPQKDAKIRSHEACTDSTEYRSVCISHDKQWRAYLHGATSEFNPNPKRLDSFRDFKCPAGRIKENRSRKFFETPNNISQGYFIRDLTDLPNEFIDFGQAAISTAAKRMEKDYKSVTDSIAAEPKRKMKLRNDQMDRYKKIQTVNDNELDIAWWDKVYTDLRYEDHRQEILSTLAVLQQMWDGRLGKIDVAKHPIELTMENVHSITSASCCPGTKAHDFEKQEVDQMLCINV